MTPIESPKNSVLRDPDDFGSRDFWKAANAHAVRRWAEEADKAARLQHLAEWAESIICNALPMNHCTQAEWDEVVKQWRDSFHANVRDHRCLPDGAAGAGKEQP
jgi:hypothetical protein